MLAAGTYREQLRTKVSGTATAPIAIVGPESGTAPERRFKAVVEYYAGAVVGINHSYYALSGFTVNGQPNIKPAAYPVVAPLPSDSFKNSVQSKAVDSKLIVIGQDAGGYGVRGVTVRDMFLHGAGGECVRMRNSAQGNVISNSVIQWCGMYRKSSTPYVYHNGEGVYVGTSPKSTDQPWHRNDASRNNVVRDNVVRTHGSECFNVKENASRNEFKNNKCSHNDEPGEFGGSNVELRGNYNTVTGNTISDSRGWNISVKSDVPFENVGNVVTGNSLSGAVSGTFR